MNTPTAEPRVVFCGCIDRPGHFEREKGERQRWMMTPLGHLDRAKQWGSHRGRQGHATTTHVDGWTVISAPDYTVDRRPGSHATFAIELPLLSFAEALAYARRDWPEIVDRVQFVEHDSDGAA